MRPFAALLLGIALSSGSCKPKPKRAEVSFQPRTLAGIRCPGSPESKITKGMSVRVWRGDVPLEAIEEQTRSAASYFAPLGLSFSSRGQILSLKLPHAFEDKTLDPAIVKILERPSDGENLRIVVLPRLLGPKSRLQPRLPDLAGLAIVAASAQALGLPEPAVPTILLSARDMRLLPDGVRPFTLAHEIGHILGGTHPESKLPTLLMSTRRREDCIPRFVLE